MIDVLHGLAALCVMSVLSSSPQQEASFRRHGQSAGGRTRRDGACATFKPRSGQPGGLRCMLGDASIGSDGQPLTCSAQAVKTGGDDILGLKQQPLDSQSSEATTRRRGPGSHSTRGRRSVSAPPADRLMSRNQPSHSDCCTLWR